MPSADLLAWAEVTLTVDLAAIISRNGVRAACDRCGEEIINQRELVQAHPTLCQSCADGGYYAAAQ